MVQAEEKVEDTAAEVTKQTKLKELSDSIVRQLEEDMDEMRLKQKVTAGGYLVKFRQVIIMNTCVVYGPYVIMYT